MKSVYLAHLGYNMWKEAPVDRIDGIKACELDFGVKDGNASYDMRFDTDEWDRIIARLIDAGADTILLDIGEGIVYDTHPELAVNGSWTKNRLSDEIDRLKKLGIKVYPKLNFSSCHDEWLGEWARMLSTPGYYKTCADVIDEVCELFPEADMFHLGMDEEGWDCQRTYKYVVIRQGELWWSDLFRLFRQVEKHGKRPWVWSDYVWHHEELFWQNMPLDVVQSNWYYGNFRDEDKHRYGFYDELARRGYDQIPGGSNWSYPDNMQKTAEYLKNIPHDHLLGIMQTVWHPTINEHDSIHEEAIKALGEANKILGI